MKRILYVTATEAEAVVLRDNACLSYYGNNIYRYGSYELVLLTAGIGSVPTSWSMMKWLSENGKPDLAINAGIAGSFHEGIKPGMVVLPVSEIIADAGIEDNGKFLSLQEAGLADPEEFPYKGGVLAADMELLNDLNYLKVRGLTVGMATGSETTRERLINLYNPDIETMEGASFFYICLRENVPFIALRAISNYVGPRNRKEWKIEMALENLKGTLNDVIIKMHNR